MPTATVRENNKQIIVNVPQKKYRFVKELLDNLSFVEIEEGDSKEEIIENLRQAFKELNLVKEGKLKGRDAKELFK